DGMVKTCNKFHLVKTTTTCASIESYYTLPLATFYKWNPAVGTNCQSLLASYYVCVGVIGWEPTPTDPGNGIATPSPIQSGMVKTCNKFHLVKSTTTCASIESYYTLPLATFYKWNPAMGTKCQALQTNTYVCVSIIGWKPTPTDPGNGISTPTPIQSGMTKSCKKFHLVKTTTTCASTQEYYSITFANLYKWNPPIGSKCTTLWAQYYVCCCFIMRLWGCILGSSWLCSFPSLARLWLSNVAN
ncbi:carbohydrate-binding module family 50 protein, partial [Dactylonectria macrodidyma]